ncbi:MBL fold metallo-hydrolase [Dactylosporangium sp. CA-092794]|uniref:MBL fold metallo-hydrolase n=1 Tax=Dactylosporangium sp. CA-092794 TaxID=3239929 RepID=UPI003D8C0636
MSGGASGPHDLGVDCHAWLVGAGGWGQSNTGLVRGTGSSLLVDTLLDLPHTAQMLQRLAPLTDRHPIRTVVNTHSDGDHWFGNQLVAEPGVEIIASQAAAASMTPATAVELASLWARDDRIGEFVRAVAGSFDPAGITPTPPTRTFSGELDLDVGGRRVRLVEVGPAHTAGDTVVHVPDARVVYTGDIVFIGGAPLVWDGPVSRCIAACDLLLDLDVTAIVPGHGPVTDKSGVGRVRDYLAYVELEATKRFEAGLDVAEAISSIDLDGFPEMSEHERIAANVTNVYEELDPTRPRAGRLEQFDLMATVHLCAAAPRVPAKRQSGDRA